MRMETDTIVARAQRTVNEASLLRLAIESVRNDLIELGLWPADGQARHDRADAVVSADWLVQIARTVYYRAAFTARKANGERERP